MNWYTLRVISGKESKIRENLLYELDMQNLSKEVGDVLVPSENIVEMKEGKKGKDEAKPREFSATWRKRRLGLSLIHI